MNSDCNDIILQSPNIIQNYDYKKSNKRKSVLNPQLGRLLLDLDSQKSSVSSEKNSTFYIHGSPLDHIIKSDGLYINIKNSKGSK